MPPIREARARSYRTPPPVGAPPMEPPASRPGPWTSLAGPRLGWKEGGTRERPQGGSILTHLDLRHIWKLPTSEPRQGGTDPCQEEA